MANESTPTGALEIDELLCDHCDGTTPCVHCGSDPLPATTITESTLDERINAGCTCARAGLCWHCTFAAEVRAALSASEARAAAAEKALAICDNARVGAINAHSAACLELTTLRTQLGDCEPFLKEHETPAECIERNRADVSQMLGLLATERSALEAKSAEVSRLTAELEKAIKRDTDARHFETLQRAACDRYLAAQRAAEAERDTARQDCEARDRVLRELVEWDKDNTASNVTARMIAARARQLLGEKKS